MRRLSQRGLALTTAAIFIVALAVVVTLVVVVGGHGRNSFDQGSVDELTKALHAKGLVVCASTAPDQGRGEGGSISTQVLSVSLPQLCADSIDVRIDAYSDASHRDGAARNAEAQERARHYGVVWTWHHYTLYLQSDDASGPTDVRDRIVNALDWVGAR